MSADPEKQGNVSTGDEFAGRDRIIQGDEVHGDKVLGDKINVYFSPEHKPPSLEPGPLFLVPFPHNPDFIGRDAELAALHQMLQQGGSPVGIRPTMLVGLGGIGKTQLAVEYAHAHRAEYPGGVFWLNAVNSLLLEFAMLAEALGFADRDTPRDQAAYKVWAYLDAHPDALVIFDNVLEPAALNQPFAPGLIPANLRCRTLFTTRQRDFPRGFSSFEVNVLPIEPAMRLLLRARPDVLDECHSEHHLARMICYWLGCLPLALELAAAYLATYPEVTLEGYVERLRIEGRLMTLDDTELHPEDLPTRHEVAVSATLRTQWARLDDEDARLLFLTAGQFPEVAWIPTARLGLLTGVEVETMPGHAAPFARALHKLHAVSLIEELTADQLRLHPLVCEFAVQLAPQGFRAEIATRLADALDDLNNLQNHVIQRGVYAVLEDVRMGLWLAKNSSGDREQTLTKLSALERLLDREAHHLRDWTSEAQPSFFLQQVRNRAFELGITDLQSRAETLLVERHMPYLRERIKTGRESDALVRTLEGHTDSVTGVAVTPDGHFVVSASCDKTLKVWDLQNGRDMRTLKGHTKQVNDVAVTPDGYFAVSASSDKTLKVWDLQSGQAVRTLKGHSDSVRSVVVTHDGQFAVSVSEGTTLKVWDFRSGQAIRTLVGHTDKVNSVAAIGPDGRFVVSTSEDKTLKIWDLQSGQALYTLKGHSKGVLDVAVGGPGGRVAVSVSADDTIKVWDLQSSRVVRTLKGHGVVVDHVVVTPDGHFAIGVDLTVWDLHSGQAVGTLKGHTHFVNNVAVTPDGHFVISASSDKTLRVWDLTSLRPVRTPEGHSSDVTCIALTPDGAFAVSASKDETLKIWDILSGRVIRTLIVPKDFMDKDPVDDVAITADGHLAVSVSWNSNLKVWDLTSGRIIRTFKGTPGVNRVTVTLDGRSAVWAVFDTLYVLDLQRGKITHTLKGHTEKVLDVAITPDGRFAVSASEDCTLKVWDLQSGQAIHELKGHEGSVFGVAVALNGNLAISASSDKTLKIWDLRNARVLRTLQGHTETVYSVAVTPDCHTIISSSADKTIKVWKLATSLTVSTLTTNAPCTCCAVTPDGRTIVAGDELGSVHIVDWVSGEAES